MALSFLKTYKNNQKNVLQRINSIFSLRISWLSIGQSKINVRRGFTFAILEFSIENFVVSIRCHSHTFPDDLPTTSIIIVFHNEGNSTLLRTLTSIILRSPIKYIHEVILVDDASIGRGEQRLNSICSFLIVCLFVVDYLKDNLEAFLKDFPVPARVLRNENRLGLIKSRLRGAEIATGDTLTFLDAHIECSPGWLEYLLYEVKKDRYDQ